MIDTVFNTKPYLVRISHRITPTPPSKGQSDLTIVAKDCEPNTLSQIHIENGGVVSNIYIHWESHSSASELQLLLCPEANTMFVGGGTVSKAINLLDMKIVNGNPQTLFWSYKWCQDYVLELGELDCYLHQTNGKCVGHASVDPPYEITETESAIRFESIVAGSQWIKFPETT